MILKKLQLFNYKTYYGQQELNLYVPQEVREEEKFYNTKLEWIESYYNIKFCLQHNVEFQYDKNRYFECSHCGNLVSRHLQDTHDCDMVEYESCYKLTKLDYIVRVSCSGVNSI